MMCRQLLKEAAARLTLAVIVFCTNDCTNNYCKIDVNMNVNTVSRCVYTYLHWLVHDPSSSSPLIDYSQSRQPRLISPNATLLNGLWK